MKQPENFFTYNNGIAIVARSVKFSTDGSKITYFKDLQIINGGQTTAALASAIIKNEAPKGMDNLFVPMKLTVLNVEDDMSEEQVQNYNELTKTISECANSQNAVKPADFFSNHPFHVKMEQLSRKVMAPPVGGNPYQTIWFYERSRGKWEQEQMKLNAHQRDLFKQKNPKDQLITKEKLAKCYNAILMHPDQVCKSSADNFKIFAPLLMAYMRMTVTASMTNFSRNVSVRLSSLTNLTNSSARKSGIQKAVTKLRLRHIPYPN